ncbi:MAG: type II secretion system protein [Acidobacteriota bacterium]|nr:type II secretion system protein [Acidobacteriota bacterium]
MKMPTFERDRRRATKAGPPRPHRGFTLLELMIVISIIAILATLAVPRVEQSIKSARYAAQQQDLSVLNQAIQQYTKDKGMPPSSLDDLQTAGYIGSIPVDPVTRQRDWTPVQCDELFSADQTSDQGICGVQVGSDQQDSSSDQSSSPQ